MELENVFGQSQAGWLGRRVRGYICKVRTLGLGLRGLAFPNRRSAPINVVV
jgi:hypothetical protein